jgi:hypothetical protein
MVFPKLPEKLYSTIFLSYTNSQNPCAILSTSSTISKNKKEVLGKQSFNYNIPMTRQQNLKPISEHGPCYVCGAEIQEVRW